MRPRLKKFINNQAISIFLVFVIALSSFSQGLLAQAPDRFTKFQKFETPSLPTQELLDYQQIEEALIQKDISRIPKNILDPNLLLGQRLVTPDGKQFLLEELTLVPPIVAADELQYRVDSGNLIIEGLRGGNVTGQHIISNINAVSVVNDEELVIVATQDGRLLALDVGLVVQQKFRAPIPVYKIFDSTKDINLNFQSGLTQLTFLTRGLKPFSKNEITQVSSQGLLPIVPRDEDGHYLLRAGDLYVYNQSANGHRELLGIFNRNVIYTMVRKGTISIAVQSALTSHVGYTDNFGDKLERALMLDMPIGTKSLLQNIIDLIQIDDTKTDVEELQKRLTESDPLVRAIFQKVDRKELKSLVARTLQQQENAKKYQSGADQFTLSQWAASFEKMSQQLEAEQSAIQARLQNAGLLEQQSLNNNLALLSSEKANNDLRGSYRNLAKAAIYEELIFSQEQKAWHKRIPWKSLRKIAWISSAAGLSSWASFKGASHFFPTEFTLLLNWMNEHMIPEVLKGTYKGVPYWQPALYGGAALLALMPAMNVLGWSMAPLLQWAGLNWSRIANQFPRLKNIAGIGTKLRELGDEFKPLTIWQRIVTTFTRPYAYFVLPFIHWLDSYMLIGPMQNLVPEYRRQSMINAIKVGLNPFTRIDGNSDIGSQIGLSGDEKLWLGNSNPFKNSEELISQKEKQKKAVKILVQNRNQATILSWALASLVVAEEEGVDPATLVALQTGELKPKDLERLEKDPTLMARWELTAKSLAHDLFEIAKKEGPIKLGGLDEENLIRFHNLAKQTARSIKTGGRFGNTLKKLKLAFQNFKMSSLQTLGQLGTEEFEFLRKVTASPYVGRQTAQGFVYDHAIVVGLPIAWGERADLSMPQNLAHDPEGRLWSTDAHLNDVFYNFMVHLIFAGPRKTLVYQRVSAKRENNYDALEQTVLKTTARREGFWRAAGQWLLSPIKRVKDVNLGSYYIYNLKRKFNTIQAGLILTFASRMALTDQTMGQIWMAYILTWVAAELSYGWPWTILERGNQFEEERIDSDRAKIEALLEKISIQLRRGQTGELQNSYNDLLALYAAKNNPATQEFIKSVKSSELMLQLPADRIIKNERIQNSLENLKRRSEVLQALIQLEKAQATHNKILISKAYEDLQTATEATLESPEFAALQNELKDQAAILLNSALEKPPGYTSINPLTSNLSTLGFGAILTTYMAIGLMVDSFDPDKLTAGNIGVWAAKTGAFLSAMYLAVSRYMWEKHYTPAWNDKVVPKLRKYLDEKTCDKLLIK